MVSPRQHSDWIAQVHLFLAILKVAERTTVRLCYRSSRGQFDDVRAIVLAWMLIAENVFTAG